jgi:hypothetical protein
MKNQMVRPLVQRIADLSNIFAQIVDLPCNLIRILDCDFIVELLVDPNLDKTIVGSANFVLKSTDLYTPINPPPPHYFNNMSEKIVFAGKCCPCSPPKTWDPRRPCT